MAINICPVFRFILINKSNLQNRKAFTGLAAAAARRVLSKTLINTNNRTGEFKDYLGKLVFDFNWAEMYSVSINVLIKSSVF